VNFAYATSHRIDEVGPGLLRKDLSSTELIGGDRAVKPAFVHDSRREPGVYRNLLGPLSIGPRCFASGRDWVVLERVNGVELWQVGELSTWQAVARWLAGMHARLTGADCGTDELPLLEYDEALMSAWQDRAASVGVPSSVLAAYERAASRLSTLPRSVIHGEFYASNVLVRASTTDREFVDVWPVDWELAGRGPAVLDLAALTAGAWSTTARTAMARAYFEATCPAPAPWETWCADLDAARLHQCVQWLAWSPGWTPPPEHRHDWLGEAMALAQQS